MALPTLQGLSICAGIGGIDLGLRRALGPSYSTACYIEQEIQAAAVLVARMEDQQLCSAPIWSDLHTFNPAPWAGHINLVSAGIPCQPWSVAGKRRGHFDERHLWSPTFNILQVLQPPLFFLENVPGIFAQGGLEPIWRDLCEMGYQVAGGFFTASSLGASHIRKRFFLLAYADRVRQLQQRETQKSGRRTDNRSFKDSAAHYRVSPAHVADTDCDQRGCESTGGRNLENANDRIHAGREEGAGQPVGCGCENIHLPGPQSSESLLGRIVDGLSAGLDRNQWGPNWEKDCSRVTSERARQTARLTMLGNAVVPAVAAHAFATLARNLHDERVQIGQAVSP